MKLTPLKAFLYTAVPFAVLGAAFKVMVLVEGLTEIRPANAIPVIAGLLCGPAGALGCAAGNLIADLFGTLSPASIPGMAANFLAAFLPWRLWSLFSSEKPNVHTYRNLGLFALLSLVSALTVSWLLGFGLDVFFGGWQQEIYIYVFLNNFAFSLGLGLPLFIVLTSDSVDVEPWKRPARCLSEDRRISFIVLALYTIIMAIMLAGALAGYHPGRSAAMAVLSAAALPLLAYLCFGPFRRKRS